MYPLWLASNYYDITKDASIFDAFFNIPKVLETLENERNHDDANYMITIGNDRDAGP